MISILLIDDNADDLEYIGDLLLQASPDVFIKECQNGADGLTEAANSVFDCVLLDLRLDGEDGIDVLEKLRAERPLIPVIVLTGQGSEQSATAAFVAGASYYLAKNDLAKDMLWTAVTRVIHQAKTESELKSKREAMERSNRLDAVGQLAAGIAHDFNNQLGTLTMAIQRIRDTADNMQSDAYVDIAFKTIDESRLLASRLLSLSDQGALHARNVDMHDLFDDLRALTTSTVAKNIQLNLAETDKELVAFCDRGQLVNAVLNLILNAGDAVIAKPGSGTINVTAERAHGKVRITVQDDGVGMSEALLTKCSDPFFTTKQDRNGTGLGLAMVQSFANENGGSLILKSTLGVGTEATLVLPEGQKPEIAENDLVQQATQNTSVAHILLVEDQYDLAKMTREVLSEAGFSIDLARDADEAIAYLTIQNQISLLITDVKMPGMNGFELARYVRKNHPSIKIMYLTGYAEKPELNQVFFGPILRKPVDSAKLIATIKDVLAGT